MNSTEPSIKLDKQAKRELKSALRLPTVTYRSKTRFLVSVFITQDINNPNGYWLEDIHFKYIEDATVHAARWRRLYGATVVRVSEVTF